MFFIFYCCRHAENGIAVYEVVGGELVPVRDVEEIATACSKNPDNSAQAEEMEVGGDNADEVNKLPEVSQRGRKRKVNKCMWKQTIRKTSRQSGKTYTNCKGQEVSERMINIKGDHTNCRNKCACEIDNVTIEHIFMEFYSLTDDEKFHFYDRTTERISKQRVRKENKNSNRPRTFSFRYYLNIKEKRVRVCKDFYLGVLNISQQRINYFHDKKKPGLTGTPTGGDQRGKKTTKRIGEAERRVIKDHIDSFHRVPAHYCREQSSREYFEQGLNLSKMYDMYREHCISKEPPIEPQSKWLYNEIFTNEYNIGFHVPKTDQCDTCKELETLKKNNETVTAEKQEIFNKHEKEKLFAREEKHKDKAEIINHNDMTVVCFDLQKVLSCPQSSTSSFYYKRKLCVFNLTGYDMKNKQGYCILWHEGISGRSGNDIASAVTQLLEEVVKETPNLQNIILWSDSCVPQNRNSLMALALKNFVDRDDNSVKTIHQKFQEPGHSCVQEVDSLHSVIEKHFRGIELHSPLTIVRALLNCRSKKKLKVVQLRLFKDFKKVAQLTNLSNVPFSKVKHIIYEMGDDSILFKTTLESSVPLSKVSLSLRTQSSRSSKKSKLCSLPAPSIVTRKPQVDAAKAKDIKSLYKYFSGTDKILWDSILK